MATTRFLNIDKFGKLYERAKQGDPGAIETTTKSGQFWRVPVEKTIIGHINFIGIVDVSFNNIATKVLRLSITDDAGNVDGFSFPVFTQKGDLDSYVGNLALVLEHIQPGDKFGIVPSTKTNPKGYLYKSFLLTKDGGYVIQTKEQTSSLPEPTIKEGIAGKKIYDFTERDKVLYEKLIANIERLRPRNSTSAPAAPAPPLVPVPPVSDVPDDDLPF